MMEIISILFYGFMGFLSLFMILTITMPPLSDSCTTLPPDPIFKGENKDV